jgi:hypothetical protein
VRLILDGTVVRVRIDRKATSISRLVVLGVRADGQKVLLAIKCMKPQRPLRLHLLGISAHPSVMVNGRPIAHLRH